MTHTLRKVGFGLFLLLVFLTPILYTRAGEHARVYAAASNDLNFQARLLNNSGVIVADGTYSVEFNLYNVSVAGTTQWTETHPTMTVRAGYLSVHLGSVNPFPATIDWSQEQWLTMNVNGDGEMSPRLKLTAVPLAFRAVQADGITNGAGVLGANDLAQLAPASAQVINSALAALRINQTGAGGLLQLQNGGSDIFAVAGTGTINSSGSATFSGGTLNLGAAGQAGGLVIHDGTSNTGTVQIAALGQNTVYTLPDPVSATATICLTATCFANDGNSFGGLATIGTNDAFDFVLEAAGSERIRIDQSTGNVKIGSGAAGEKLEIDGAIKLGTTTGTNAGTLRWTGTDFEGYNGSEWQSLTDTGGLVVNPTANKRKAVDETQNIGNNATATLQNDDELFFGIGANETWSFSFVVQSNNPAAPDIKFAVTAPAGATCKYGQIDAEGTTTTSNLACGASTGIIVTTAGEDVFIVTGTVVNGATAGNVTLQWAQGTANAANTIVRAGSHLTANRIAGTGQTAVAFIQDGITLGAQAVLGTNDTNSLAFETDGTNRLVLDASGNLEFQQASTISAPTIAGAGYGLTLRSGSSTGAAGGTLNLLGGSGGGFGGTGGAVNITAGTAAAFAGDVNITAGSTTGGVQDGGDITINAGTSAGGLVGTISIGTTTASSVTIGNATDNTALSFNSGTGIISIGAGSSSGQITIGGGSAPLVIDSTNFDVSSGGLLSGISGYTQSSGNFNFSGTGTFGTGTGLVSLNGSTTISAGNTLAVLGSTTISPASNSEVGLTINGTSGTAATALVVTQTGNAANAVLTNTASTSGALISLTHATSAFTGTGLLLNLASGSGSFASGNFADFQINSVSRFSVDNTGALAINSDSASALRITSTAGVQYLDVDVAGNQVTIGNSDTTGVQFVLDTKTDAGDPLTGVNGGMYYNSNANKFRCYENSEWEDCSPGAANIRIVGGLDTSAAATNLAATTLNCVSDPSLRAMVNFSNVNKLRWIGKIGGSINAATKIRLQYHLGGNIAVATGDAGWTTLDTSAGAHTLSTYFYAAETTVPSSAQINNLVVRACVYDGNGVADPTITGLQLNAYR